MAINKTAMALLVVGLIVGVGLGYGIGFMVYQPEIGRLNTNLSTAQSEIDGLETQVSSLKSERSDLEAQVSSLTSEVSAMQSDLEDAQGNLEKALGEVATLETKTSAIKEACVQLEKDRVFLETFQKKLTTVTVTLEEELASWSNVRESSAEVDPTLPSKIDTIMDDVRAIFDWVERGTALMLEEPTWEEVALWQQEGMTLQAQYNVDFYVFEAAYISAIQSHIRAVTELTES